MRKFILSLIVMVMSVFAIDASAQVAYQKTNAFDNTYVGAGVGVTTPLSFNQMFPLNTTFSLKVGKNLNTVFGLNVEGTTWFGSNGTRGHFDFGYGHNAFRAVSVGLNGTINLTNAILGYNPNKTFEVYTETGLGYLATFNANADNANDLFAKTGLVLGWSLGQAKAWQLVLNPTIYWNLTRDNFDANNGVKFNKNHAQLGLNVGIVYKFKTSNGTHNFKTYDVGALNSQIDNLRAELAKKPKEVVRVEKVVETNTVTVAQNAYVFFAQNSADLTDEAKTTLDNVSGTVEVTATASPEGTEEYNKALSQRRADVVKEYLEGKGVTVTKAEGLGVQGDSSNRVSVVTIK